MRVAHDRLTERAYALADYLYRASTDGRGPEIFPCEHEDQARALWHELVAIQHLGDQPVVQALRQGSRVTVWLTNFGWARMRAKHGPRPQLGDDSGPLFWFPELEPESPTAS